MCSVPSGQEGRQYRVIRVITVIDQCKVMQFGAKRCKM
jgi:hypothetical protein